MARAKVKEYFDVTGDEHGPADVAAALGEGKELRWPNTQKWFALPKEMLERLSKAELAAYKKAEASEKARLEEMASGDVARYEIISLLPGNERNKKAFDPVPGVHFFWASLEQAFDAYHVGYNFVDSRQTRYRRRVPMGTPRKGAVTEAFERLSVGEGSREVPLDKREYYFPSGTEVPSLVAMWVPEERFMASERARSRRAALRTRGAETDAAEARRELGERFARDPRAYDEVKVEANTRESRREMTLVGGGEG